jgi:uncharacterized protein YcbX
MNGRVAGLFVYPVKGCAGTGLGEARLLARGLEHDRRWMIVNSAGRFITQREQPALARILPLLGEGELTLRFPDGSELRLPIVDEGEPLRVTVWRDEVDAVAVSTTADAALSGYLSRPVRLVRFPEASLRACDPAFAPSGSHTGFADAFPLLVTSLSSLDELNDALLERGAEPVPMTRFRPNLVLAGLPRRAEDEASRLRLTSGVEFLLVKPCDRCIVTTTDQVTGERMGNEPIATLRRIRRNPGTGGVSFGQNGVPVLAAGATVTLRVGEAFELLPT